MAKTGQKVLLGCGIGCGLIIVVGLIVGGGIGLLLKDVASSFKQAEKTGEILVERYGEAEDYDLPAFGIVATDRIEAFLAVRETTTEARTGIVTAIAKLEDEDNDRKGVREIVNKIKAGVGVGTEIGRLLEARNTTLIDVGMGIGEYTYIYCLTYYALLGHSPTDGPDGGKDIRIGRGGKFMHVSEGDDDGTGHGGYRQVRRDLRRMLKREAYAIGEDTAEEEKAWRARIETELERMSDDRSYVPWQIDMPEPMANALEPYADRLDATYAPLVNLFELIPAED